MTVRAKLKCQEKAQLADGYFRLRFTAVAGDSPENEKFFATTPSASLEFTLKSSDTAGRFEPGKEYYADFTPAGEEA